MSTIATRTAGASIARATTPPGIDFHETSLPITRATALKRWRTAIAWTVAIQAAATLIDTALDSLKGSANPFAGLLSIGEAGLIALVLVLMTRHAEARLLCRPPKALLAWQLGAFIAMAVVETTLLFVNPAPDWFSDAPFLVGHLLAFVSFLLVAGWFVGTKVVLAGIDES